MNFFTQTEQAAFIIALIANITLLILVLRYAERNIARIMFTFFVLAQVFWITMNSFAFQQDNPNFLLLARLTLLAASFHAFFFLMFMRTFLEKRNVLTKASVIPLVVCLTAIGALTLSPLVFSSIITQNGIPTPQVGPGIAAFGFFVSFCIIGGFYYLVRKFRISKGIEKIQWSYLFVGFSLTFLLVLGLSFVNFIFFKNLSTVRFGHLYTLPFLIFTAYAMIKYHLLNLKAILAELTVIILNLILIIQLVNSNTVEQFITATLVLVASIIVGILLVRGVRREVEQRVQLEGLTKQLKGANEQLKVLDQARAEFITIASHQLRTPPATLKWYLASILDGDYGKMDDTIREQLRKMASTNNSMISLIDDLLNVSRIERGKLEFIFQPTDFAEIAQVTLDQLLPQAEMKKLSLTLLKPKEALPIIAADKEKLRQVMNNFIDNAIKYTPAGKIEVSVSKSEKDLVFKVTDTGRGVTKEQGKHIFEKFDRGKSPARNSTGLGLGLYVAKVIVEMHKGKVWIESKGAGKGSTFAFSVPIKSKQDNSVFDLTKTQQIKK